MLSEKKMYFRRMSKAQTGKNGSSNYIISVGHGQSEGSRVHVNNFQEYVDDCLLHAVKIRKELPNTPMFILGFSMVTFP